MGSHYIENVSFSDAAVYIMYIMYASSIVSSVMTSPLSSKYSATISTKGCIREREYTTVPHSLPLLSCGYLRHHRQHRIMSSQRE